MDSFWVAVRVVLPMALLMLLGAFVRKRGVVDRPAMRQVDKLIFRLFVPMLLFKNIYETDLSASWDYRAVGFTVAGLLAVFLLALVLPSRLEPDRGKAAAIGQSMIRSNYILFGVAVAESLYGKGNVGEVALLGAIVVPLSNALSVVILEMNRSGSASPGKICISILKNPMVAAALLALGVQALHIRLPEALWSVVKDVAGATTTISFISLGVSLDFGEVLENRRPLMWGVVLRMLILPAVFLPLMVAFGFRGQTLCALMVAFTAPTAVASYPMAVAMGADGPLAGQLVCTTAVVSVGTMFLFTYIFQSLGML